MTALTLYGIRTADATLTTASDFVTTTGGTESAGGGVTNAATGNGWLEAQTRSSSGNAGTATGSIGNPSGQGYVYMNTALENQATTAGTWTFKLPMIMTTTNTTFNTITVRLYKYNINSLTYTAIASTSLTSQAITTAKTSLTFTFSSVPATLFVTGDRIYVDMWYQLTGGFNANTAFQIYRSSTSAGVVGDSELDTPGYTPATTVFKDVTVRGKINANIYKDITVRGKISKAVNKDVTFRGKVGNLAHKSITVRGKVYDRNFSGGVALYANGTGTAQFDHLRAVQLPDPSASLSNVGRALYSVANWNGNFPVNTTCTTSTSLDDGATYQTATLASDISGLSTQLYSTAVLQKKPVVYYRLTESVSPSIDASGHIGNAPWTGTITPGQTGVLQGPGEIANTTLLFDGSTGYITVPSSLVTTATDFAVSVWINVGNNFAMSAGFQQRVFIDNIDNTNAFQIALQDSNNAIVFAVNDSTGQVITSKQGFLQNTWYHVVGTWIAATRTIALYVNGQLQANDAGATSYGIGSVATNIGRRTDGVGFFTGKIAELSVFNPSLANGNADLIASDIFSLYNFGLAGVGQTANDSFTADTHTSYTQTFGTGGVTATWTWDTVNSRLIAVGGTNAFLLYNNIYAYDVDILIDLYQAENAGMIWGYQNASNYYSLIIKDSAAISGANTATIYKTVAGVATQLVTTSITFPTQTYHRFHFTMLSAVMVLLMDENQILTYTDSTPFSAGLTGLRNDTGTSYIYQFEMTPQPVDVSTKFLTTKHTLTTTSPTVTPQVTDHQGFAGNVNFGPGVLVPSADYEQTYVSDNLDDLNTKSNYWWQIGPDKNIVFQPRNARNAPWILQASDILTGTMATVEYSGDMYRNRQVLKGVYDTGTFGEIRHGDGSTQTWNVSNPIISIKSITLNGLIVTFGIKGRDTGKQYYYQINDTAIDQDSGQTVLQATDTLAVTYTGAFGIDFSIDNTGQISKTLSQSQMAAIDGTDGIVEAVEDISDQNMNVAAATIYANTLLQRYGTIARTIKFQTLHSGLKVGHNISIFLPQLNIFDSSFLVVEISISARTLGTGLIQYVYEVIASEAAALSSWVKMFSKVMRTA